jgi:hypothetical protein
MAELGGHPPVPRQACAFRCRLVPSRQRRRAESQLVELTAAVALENFRSKFSVPLGIESQGFSLLP